MLPCPALVPGEGQQGEQAADNAAPDTPPGTSTGNPTQDPISRGALQAPEGHTWDSGLL